VGVAMATESEKERERERKREREKKMRGGCHGNLYSSFNPGNKQFRYGIHSLQLYHVTLTVQWLLLLYTSRQGFVSFFFQRQIQFNYLEVFQQLKNLSE